MRPASLLLLAITCFALGSCADAATEPSTPSPSCQGGGKPYVDKTAPDPARAKFAMSLFHFNVEYVIGGLDYRDADGTQHLFMNIAANAGWDDAKVEDYIIQQTFAPILQMYDKHPSWGVDIELQARMVETMAARHPEVLALLRKLAQRGQVELVSFHANDQLFLAFPALDLHRSIETTKQVFAKHCLPLSGVVFNQEGQAGEGRQQMLLKEGYSVGVFPKNLWRYVHADADKAGFWPLYSSEGGDLIVSSVGVDPASGLQVAWNFFDDGELRATPTTSAGALNPYFAPNAATDPARVAEFEADLASTEAQGYYLARIGDYVRHLKAKGVQAKVAPPLLDGTWQAPSTQSIHRWMGGRGLLDGLFRSEDDDGVRTGNMRARHQVQALEQLAMAAAASSGKPYAPQQVDGLWRKIFRAEVSDCSGVNPWYAEVQIGLVLNEEVLTHAKLAWSLAQVHAPAWSLATGKPWPFPGATALPSDVTVVAGVVVPAAQGPVDAPLPITLTATDRTATAQWAKVDKDRWRLTVQIGPSQCDGKACKPDARVVGLQLPRWADTLEYCPALIEDQVRSYPLAAFQFAQGEAWLPLANGLAGLGNGWYVIKHTSSSHLSLRVAPADKTVQFLDETLPDMASRTWVFEVLQGSADAALKVAISLNTLPTVAIP